MREKTAAASAQLSASSAAPCAGGAPVVAKVCESPVGAVPAGSSRVRQQRNHVCDRRNHVCEYRSAVRVGTLRSCASARRSPKGKLRSPANTSQRDCHCCSVRVAHRLGELTRTEIRLWFCVRPLPNHDVPLRSCRENVTSYRVRSRFDSRRCLLGARTQRFCRVRIRDWSVRLHLWSLRLRT